MFGRREGDYRPVLTSENDPLRVAEIPIRHDLGILGVTFAPGKRDRNSLRAIHERDMDTDLNVVRDWGAQQVVTLLEPFEFGLLNIEELGAEVEGRGMGWLHLPIRDVWTPGHKFERQWESAWPVLRDTLMKRGNIVVHCRGGLGRAGLVAARILIEMGIPNEEAITRVRQARPGAIETARQERYVRKLRP